MRRKGPARDAGKERFWRKNIGQQQRSGQSIREFCRAQGLSEPSFYAWRGELKRRRRPPAKKTRGSGGLKKIRGGPPKFVSLRLNADIAPPGQTIEAALPSGVVVRFPASIEPAAVVELLNAWEQGRC